MAARRGDEVVAAIELCSAPRAQKRCRGAGAPAQGNPAAGEARRGNPRVHQGHQSLRPRLFPRRTASDQSRLVLGGRHLTKHATPPARSSARSVRVASRALTASRRVPSRKCSWARTCSAPRQEGHPPEGDSLRRKGTWSCPRPVDPSGPRSHHRAHL